MRIAGKRVKDGNKDVILHITKQDCRLGDTKDPGACAAARAIMRECEATKARVHLSRIYIEKNDHWERYYTPPALRNEIIAFDRGGTFEPGEYKLPKPSPSKRLGVQQGSKTNQNKKTKPRIARIKHHITSGVRHSLIK